MENEIWKAISGYEGRYEVSNYGRVKSLARKAKSRGNGVRQLKERILSQFPNPRTGYITTTLTKNNINKTVYVHHLVSDAFNGPRPKGMDVHHVDEDKTNNRADNLEFLNRRDNCNYSKRYYTSGFPGVCWAAKDKKWKATIQINGKIHFLGHFINEVEAYRAYLITKLEYENKEIVLI